MMKLATLCVLALTTLAHADPVQTKPPADGTIEHFEYHWKSTFSERTTTTQSPTRSVVERWWSETSGNQWSHSSYVGDDWMTDQGLRSNATGGQTSTVRKRPYQTPRVTRRSPCPSSRARGDVDQVITGARAP